MRKKTKIRSEDVKETMKAYYRNNPRSRIAPLTLTISLYSKKYDVYYVNTDTKKFKKFKDSLSKTNIMRKR